MPNIEDSPAQHRSWQPYPDTSPNTYYIESGIDHTDGVRTTVGWSVEDDAWIAQCHIWPRIPAMGDGPTKEAALLHLVSGMAAMINVLQQEIAELRERGG